MGSALSQFFIEVKDIPKTFAGFVQIISLLIAYGFILSKSSAMISDGSELLLLIPALAGIVGSVVLPVLGAVPDGAIVLFSGLGPKEEVQQQLSVGVGALAGSTIMLLTIPWALCIYMGRVELDASGVANYRSKSPKKGFSLFGEGVTPRPSIAVNGKIMILTAVSYIIIQASSFAVHCDLEVEPNCNPAGQHWVAFVALLFCIAFFIGYLVYNVKHANDEDKEDFVQEVKKQAIESHIISLSVAFEKDLGGAPSSKDSLLSKEDGEKKFDAALKSFFRRYDHNGDGVIDRWELKSLLADVNESLPEDKFNQLLKAMDTDNSGVIEFGEFCVAMRDFVKRKNANPLEHYVEIERNVLSGVNVQSPAVPKHGASTNVETHDEEEEEEEEEEDVPEDLAHLPPAQQKMRILLRAAWMMGLGTAITLIFSDPMVDVLSALGDHLGINPFYIAFILAPIASNASELIASINYATKRTKKTITISLAALEGAACMNNTFCLAIFLALIFLLELPWSFSAETISIIFVELALFLYTFKPTYKVLDTFIILAIYPASLFLVWFLENVIKLN